MTYSSPPVYADFADRFPELVAASLAPDASTQAWIAARASTAWDAMAVTVWRVTADRQEGALLQAAHHLLLRRRAAAAAAAGGEIPAGPLTSRSEGEWSKSYGAPPTSSVSAADAHWMSTQYGQQWLSLRSEVVGVYGGRVSQ